MRITFVSSSLGPGGAERVMSLLANAWAENQTAVTIVTFEPTPAFFPLAAGVRHCALPSSQASRNWLTGAVRNIGRIVSLRRAIRSASPDVVISFMDTINVRVLLATRGLRVPVIISDRTDPSQHHLALPWRVLRNATYRFADRLVCQTEGVLRQLSPRLRRRAVVIPNPVVVPPGSRVACEVPRVIAMGRMSHEKGFDLLLRAFAGLKDARADWRLLLIGDGPLRAELEAQAASLHLGARVIFAGQQADPFPLLRSAELFVLPSRYEGFPSALCEALACGLPAVSFDCGPAAAEIVRSGVNGLLVPPGDVEALSSAMATLMGDAGRRRRMAAKAPDIAHRLALPAIMAKWNSVIRGLLPIAETAAGGAAPSH